MHLLSLQAFYVIAINFKYLTEKKLEEYSRKC